MPKKTKTRSKPAKLKTPKKLTKHSKRLGNLRGLKRDMTDMIEAMVSDIAPQHQLEVVEHLCDIGIDLLGVVTGVDATNALVMFPDDGIARLVQLIAKRESETSVPCEEIIEGLIRHLQTPAELAN